MALHVRTILMNRVAAFQNQLETQALRRKAIAEHARGHGGGRVLLECGECVREFQERVASEHREHARFNVDCEHCRSERAEQLVAEHPQHVDGQDANCIKCCLARSQKRVRATAEHGKHMSVVAECAGCSWGN